MVGLREKPNYRRIKMAAVISGMTIHANAEQMPLVLHMIGCLPEIKTTYQLSELEIYVVVRDVVQYPRTWFACSKAWTDAQCTFAVRLAWCWYEATPQDPKIW
jgi:hypothetical protein